MTDTHVSTPLVMITYDTDNVKPSIGAVIEEQDNVTEPVICWYKDSVYEATAMFNNSDGETVFMLFKRGSKIKDCEAPIDVRVPFLAQLESMLQKKLVDHSDTGFDMDDTVQVQFKGNNSTLFNVIETYHIPKVLYTLFREVNLIEDKGNCVYNLVNDSNVAVWYPLISLLCPVALEFDVTKQAENTLDFLTIASQSFNRTNPILCDTEGACIICEGNQFKELDFGFSLLEDVLEEFYEKITLVRVFTMGDNTYIVRMLQGDRSVLEQNRLFFSLSLERLINFIDDTETPYSITHTNEYSGSRIFTYVGDEQSVDHMYAMDNHHPRERGERATRLVVGENCCNDLLNFIVR